MPLQVGTCTRTIRPPWGCIGTEESGGAGGAGAGSGWPFIKPMGGLGEASLAARPPWIPMRSASGLYAAFQWLGRKCGALGPPPKISLKKLAKS
jgi:hypothetical protein